MNFQKRARIFWFLFFLLSFVYLSFANLTSHIEATVDGLLLALDADADGSITDETWYQTLTSALQPSAVEDTAMDPDGDPNKLVTAIQIKNYGDLNWDSETEVTLSPADMTVQRGLAIWGTAGETLSAFRLVYKKADSRYYLYDANGTDAATWPLPVAMTTTAAASAGDTVELIDGVFFLKCSDFSITFASYGGVPVYASTTPGMLTITPPATVGDHRIMVGHMWGDDRIMMSLPAMVDVVVTVTP